MLARTGLMLVLYDSTFREEEQSIQYRNRRIRADCNADPQVCAQLLRGGSSWSKELSPLQSCT
jgi:hypothetical protein